MMLRNWLLFQEGFNMKWRQLFRNHGNLKEKLVKKKQLPN